MSTGRITGKKINIDLSYTPSAQDGVVDNSNGSGFRIPPADTESAGLMTPDEKTKLAEFDPSALFETLNVEQLWEESGTDAIKPVSDKKIKLLSAELYSRYFPDGDMLFIDSPKTILPGDDVAIRPRNTAAVISSAVAFGTNGRFVNVTDDEFTITDADDKGISYADDYSANFTDRSLVDKAYVDRQIEPTQADFSNGLTKADGEVKLGGDLTEVVRMNIDGHGIFVENDTDGDYFYLDISGSYCDMYAEKEDSSDWSEIYLDDKEISLEQGYDSLSGKISVVHDNIEMRTINLDGNVQAGVFINNEEVELRVSSTLKDHGVILDSDSLRYKNIDLVDIDETSDDSTIVHKKYVDDAVAAVSGGSQPIETSTLYLPAGETKPLATAPLSMFDAVIIDYRVRCGVNLRTGTVRVITDGSNVNYTETGTTELGNTSDIVLSADLVDGNLRLVGTASIQSWDVQTLTRRFITL